MKTKFFVVFLCFVGCSFKVEQKDIKSTKTTNQVFKITEVPSWHGDLHVIVIDKCEYLCGYLGGNGGYVLCHKGNCKNPVHAYREKE